MYLNKEEKLMGFMKEFKLQKQIEKEQKETATQRNAMYEAWNNMINVYNFLYVIFPHFEPLLLI